MISLKKNSKSDMSNLSTLEAAAQEENLHSQFALQVAFQTMKERCQHFQARLAAVEEENIRLRLECGKEVAAIAEKSRKDTKDEISILKEKVEELTKQKSQLNHHIFMVAAENRQLWNRLTRLTRANKTLGNQLTKISDTLKKHPPAEATDILTYSFKETCIDTPGDNKCLLSSDAIKDQSLEEISLRLINSIMLEKCELEKQYAEMVELQTDSQVNLQNVGFTYPEDVDTDSLEQLKDHDSRLSQTKEILLSQQARLKRIVGKIKTLKKGTTCQICRKNASKILCQTGTQIDLDISIKENHTLKTNISADNLSEHSLNFEENNLSNKICPLCGESYGNSISFTEFHEHVLSHFSNEDMEVVN
ncbi:protein spindle-F [Leptopilina heterotoma]|uniref:protein spindle-F n=1 Tax=Leptopilina heterotoma TaxID=63436 RepID=UPI001CA7BBD3|nr:protein spindle-F [Leptopilina heterotoma]XP_043482092.1 protein spindle-F [Leptopilina heterotoma]